MRLLCHVAQESCFQAAEWAPGHINTFFTAIKCWLFSPPPLLPAPRIHHSPKAKSIIREQGSSPVFSACWVGTKHIFPETEPGWVEGGCLLKQCGLETAGILCGSVKNNGSGSLRGLQNETTEKNASVCIFHNALICTYTQV